MTKLRAEQLATLIRSECNHGEAITAEPRRAWRGQKQPYWVVVIRYANGGQNREIDYPDQWQGVA